MEEVKILIPWQRNLVSLKQQTFLSKYLSCHANFNLAYQTIDSNPEMCH